MEASGTEHIAEDFLQFPYVPDNGGHLVASFLEQWHHNGHAQTMFITRDGHEVLDLLVP